MAITTDLSELRATDIPLLTDRQMGLLIGIAKDADRLSAHLSGCPMEGDLLMAAMELNETLADWHFAADHP